VVSISEAWRSLPPEIKQDIQQRARLMWDLRGAYYARFVATVNALFLQNPWAWQQAVLSNRAAAVARLAHLAGQTAGLPSRRGTGAPGMSPVQVRQYHRRQQARGIVPGRSRRRMHREMELELELDRAAAELEVALRHFEPGR
jgi:hypothetical protein